MRTVQRYMLCLLLDLLHHDPTPDVARDHVSSVQGRVQGRVQTGTPDHRAPVQVPQPSEGLTG